MIALTNGKLYTMEEGIIERGTVVIADGKITAVGADVTTVSYTHLTLPTT